MPTPSLNRVEIDLGALRSNYENIKALVGAEVEVMAMVKSDAYGHGLLPAAKAFYAGGAHIFGVAEVEEAVALREAGLTGDIIVLLGAPSVSLAEVIQYKLSPVVYDLAFVKELSDLAVKLDVVIDVHLKVDLGMGRLGIMPDDVSQFVQAMHQMPGVFLAGFFSHFPLADDLSNNATEEQCQRFETILQEVNTLVQTKKIMHIANSAALIRFPETHFDMVRPGISLYGYCPIEEKGACEQLCSKPAMSFKTEVIQVKEVPAGHGISYGHKFITERPTRIAVLPVGYDDGYSRLLTGKAMVLIGGRRVPIRGTICMNACMADVTDLPDVQVGDEVVLMGTQGDEEISAGEIAGWLGTISYEVLCQFGRSNRHVYYDSSPREVNPSL